MSHIQQQYSNRDFIDLDPRSHGRCNPEVGSAIKPTNLQSEYGENKANIFEKPDFDDSSHHHHSHDDDRLFFPRKNKHVRKHHGNRFECHDKHSRNHGILSSPIPVYKDNIDVRNFRT